jgi:ferredoxin-NADP reductase
MIDKSVFGGALPVWDCEADDEIICLAVRDETADVRTFVFEAPQPARFAYKPGQFLTFDFPVDGAVVNRCYTIASTPTRPHQISITVKRQANGAVSPWLHAHMRPGVAVRVSGPMGVFSFVEHQAAKYLFMSAGSGITPLMSMARALHDLDADADIVFLHFARSPADIIFRRELDLMSRHMPNLRVVAVCETDSPGESWGGFRGRLSAAMLPLVAPDFLQREVFDCGPAPFMKAARGTLEALGFDMARYHEESFDFAALSDENAPVIEAAGAASFLVEFSKTRKTINVSAERHILDAARGAGLRLPSSCTKGMCGTCKSKLVSGKVEMNHQGGIRQREIDAGMILICCSKPLSDLVIER